MHYDSETYFTPGGRKLPKNSAEYKRRIALLEEIYGGRVYVIEDGKPFPSQPKKVSGIVLHNDFLPDGDRRWIVGDSNPELDFEQVKKNLEALVPGTTNFDEKFDEYQILKFLSPQHQPPEMRLGGDFTAEVSKAERANAEEKIDHQIAEYEKAGETPLADKAKALRDELVQLETYRTRIQESSGMGRSILKVRYLNQSEGKIPKTDKNWIDLYTRYSMKTRDEVKALIAKHGRENIADSILGKPYIEGHVLDHLLQQTPNDVVVQKMITIRKEVRIHIVNGEILFKGQPSKRMAFLRHYRVNDYLSDADLALVETEIQKYLDGLPPQVRKITQTPDIAIEEGTNRVLILDGNGQLQSGYFDAVEDMFTAALLTEHFTGVRSPFLKRWDAFKALPMGKQKVEALKRIRKRYRLVLKPWTQEPFWDRVIEHYYHDHLQKDPTPEKLNAVLQEIKNAGLSYESIYLQFLAQAQDDGLRLKPEHQRKWQKYFNSIQPDLETRIEADGRLVDFEVSALSAPCASLKKLPPTLGH